MSVRAAQEQYHFSLDFIRDTAKEWGVSIEWAAEWLIHVSDNKYFATAIMAPMVFKGAAGILLAMSTSMSTWQDKYNHNEHQLGRGIQLPHWFHFDVWWFPGMALLNFAGIQQAQFQGMKLPGNFGQFLQATCMAQKVMFPTQIMYRGPALGPLRGLLQQLSVSAWLEFTVGSSYKEYRGLDAYVRIFGQHVVSAEQEAWYMLNYEAPPQERMLLAPQSWYSCLQWKSMGQKPTVCEWLLEHETAMVPSNQREYVDKAARAFYRMLQVQSQLVPRHKL